MVLPVTNLVLIVVDVPMIGGHVTIVLTQVAMVAGELATVTADFAGFALTNVLPQIAAVRNEIAAIAPRFARVSNNIAVITA